jgi:hypothetical protein
LELSRLLRDGSDNGRTLLSGTHVEDRSGDVTDEGDSNDELEHELVGITPVDIGLLGLGTCRLTSERIYSVLLVLRSFRLYE